MEPDLEETQEELQHAISQALRQAGYYATKWLLLTEVIDNSGGRPFLSFTSPETRPWETLGLLRYAEKREAAHISCDHESD
jgi:hypothetical protein